MRFQIFLLLVTVWSTGYSQADNPFSKLKFDKVMMYDFEGGKGADLYIIDEKGQLAKSVKKQVQLSKDETAKLNFKLGNKQSYGEATAACFDPHLGLVYYSQEKVVAHITICLDCNRMHSSIDIPAQKQGKAGKGKDVYYLADGLSKTFRQYLNQLIKSNNFSHQIKESQ